jgi:site-specific DNA recombinase
VARPGYYRCGGRDGSRHEGGPVCRQASLRADMLEGAVWADVRVLLADPGRVAAEYERRRDRGGGGTSGNDDSLSRQIAKTKRGLARLIDAYTEGLVDKGEFAPRARGLKERLGRLEAEAAARARQQEQVQGLRLAWAPDMVWAHPARR